MKAGRKGFSSIDEYIGSFPEHVQTKLMHLRELIKEQAPQAEERISYQMPAFFLNGVLVYFAAYSKHIGFYPTASGIRAFRTKLQKYKSSKGAVQFPIDKPLPISLIKHMVRFRVAENARKKRN
jgi:uncharacterized protein YdhG (YjbR/CyaY superfamily)